MKDPVIARLDELRRFAAELNLFLTILNSLIVFLVFAIVLRLVGVFSIFAVTPAFIYMTVSLILHLRKINVIKSVVSNYPTLDERLQTAYENRNNRNIIVDSLIKEVARYMDEVRYSSFVSMQQLTSRVIISNLLIFVFLSLNYINIDELSFLRIPNDVLDRIEDLTGLDIYSGNNFAPGEDNTFATKNKVKEDIVGGNIGGQLPGVNSGPIPGFGGGTGEEGNPNIYGDPSAASIEGKNIDMQLHPEYGGEIEIKNVNQKKKSIESFEEIESKAAAAAEQDPVEYRELIKKYFESLQRIE